MRKYTSSFLRYLFLCFFGFIIFFISAYFISAFFEILAEYMPSVFIIYNPVTDREAYDAQALTLSLISGIAAIYALNHLAVTRDNSRYEYIISKTNGLYTLSEGARLYTENYLGADIISSLLVPVLFVPLTLISIPRDAHKVFRMIGDAIETFASLQYAFTEKLGLVLGISVMCLVSLLSRIPSAYFALKRWRGIWLSDIEH